VATSWLATIMAKLMATCGQQVSATWGEPKVQTATNNSTQPAKQPNWRSVRQPANAETCKQHRRIVVEGVYNTCVCVCFTYRLVDVVTLGGHERTWEDMRGHGNKWADLGQHWKPWADIAGQNCDCDYTIGDISGNIDVATRVATWVSTVAASAATKVAT